MLALTIFPDAVYIALNWFTMKRLMLFSLLLVVAFAGFSQNAPAEKFVKAFSEKKNTWLINKNTDSLSNMIDGRCLYIHSNGWTQTADEVIRDLQSNKLVYKKIEISELLARQFESMVIVTGKGHFEGSVDGKPFNMDLIFTEVYVKRKNSWKLVSRHSTKLA